MRIYVAIAGLLRVATAAERTSAQIASGSADISHTIQLTGILKSIQWGDPRSLVQFAVTDAQGNVQQWALEGDTKRIYGSFSQPSALDAQPKVAVIVYPLHNGQTGGVIVSISPANQRRSPIYGGSSRQGIAISSRPTRD